MTAPRVDDTAASRARTAFYAVVVTIAAVGQATASWGSADDLTWLPGWGKWIIHILAAAALELGGVALAMTADVRRRMNERAIAWLTASAAVATLAMAVNLLGHWAEPIFAAVFTGFSAFGYVVYILTSNAKRRDQLRAEGKLPPTPPHYPWALRWQERKSGLVQRARWLALEHRLGLYESIAAAREEQRQEAERAALKVALQEYLAKGAEPGKQGIALRTYDPDLIVAEMRAQADNAGVARALADELTPERLALRARAVERAAERDGGAPAAPVARVSGPPRMRSKDPREARNARAKRGSKADTKAEYRERAYAAYADGLDAGQGEMTGDDLAPLLGIQAGASARKIRDSELRDRYAREVADGTRQPRDPSTLPRVFHGRIAAHQARELSGELRIVQNGGES